MRLSLDWQQNALPLEFRPGGHDLWTAHFIPIQRRAQTANDPHRSADSIVHSKACIITLSLINTHRSIVYDARRVLCFVQFSQGLVHYDESRVHSPPPQLIAQRNQKGVLKVVRFAVSQKSFHVYAEHLEQLELECCSPTFVQYTMCD